MALIYILPVRRGCPGKSLARLPDA